MISPIKSIRHRLYEGVKALLDPSRSQEGTGEVAHKKILVFSGQPGGETLFAGGTIRHIAQTGGGVDVVFVHPKSLSSDEVASGLKACGVLGVRRTIFLESGENSQSEFTAEIIDRIQAEHYDIIFVPCPSDSNLDHMRIFRAVLDVLHKVKDKKPIWLYGTERLGLANRRVDISNTFEVKKEALEAFEKGDLFKGISELKKEELFLSMEGAILLAVSELLRHHSFSPSVVPLTPNELEWIRKPFEPVS